VRLARRGRRPRKGAGVLENAASFDELRRDWLLDHPVLGKAVAGLENDLPARQSCIDNGWKVKRFEWKAFCTPNLAGKVGIATAPGLANRAPM